MPKMPDDEPAVREAVGVFESAELLQDAIDDLMSSGFDRAELSLLASESAVEEKLGHLYLASWRTTRTFHGRPTFPRNRSVMPKAP